MSHSDGKITKPVTVADVQLTLGTSGNGVGYLCSNKHGLTNMWAKYKPVVWAKWFIDRNVLKTWWKGQAENCGLIPCSVDHYSKIIEKMDGDMNGWVYDAPKGGENSPFRLLDFDGYNHNARCPVGGFTTQGSIDPGSVLRGQVEQMISQDDELTLADINAKGIATSYFGIMVVKNGSVLKRATTTTTIDTGAYEAQVSTTGLAKGEYLVYPFLCTSRQTDGASDVAGTYFTIPGVMPATLRIEDAVSILITAKYLYTGKTRTGIQYDTSVRYNRAGTLTLTNNYLKIRLDDKGFNDPIVSGESSKKISDIKVTGSTMEYLPNESGMTIPASGFFFIPAEHQSKLWKVWVSLQSSKYLAGIQPEEEIIE